MSLFALPYFNEISSTTNQKNGILIGVWNTHQLSEEGTEINTGYIDSLLDAYGVKSS